MARSIPLSRASAEEGGLFSAEAERYDDAFDSPGSRGYALRSRMAATLRLLASDSGKILDAGMGPGRLVAELDWRGSIVTGIDSSEEMVARARARLPHLEKRLIKAEVERLPFDDSEFDAVVATGVLEYLEDRSLGLAELARVLKPDGRLIVSIPNHVSPYALWSHLVVYPLIRNVKKRLNGRFAAPMRREWIGRREFEKMLAKSDLILDHVEHASFLLVPAPFDTALPTIAARLGERLESAAPHFFRFLATQVLFVARRKVEKDGP
jgi:ubiquinone/menaquinone biosynthesis C-methylase UbiE